MPTYAAGASGRSGRAIVTNSCTAIIPATVTSAKSHQPPAHDRAEHDGQADERDQDAGDGSAHLPPNLRRRLA